MLKKSWSTKYLITAIGFLLSTLVSSSSVGALDTGFFSTNDVLFYRPGSGCTTGTESISGSANVPAYKNPVYNNSAPDPSVVQGSDGTYYVYATGGVLLKSKDLVNWEKISDNWKMSGAPNEADGAQWAPDVTKVGEKYILTYTIPTGTPEHPAGGDPQIAYAVGDDAGGPFTYKGKLSLPYPFSIDSHIFIDDDSKVWLFWGGGVINVVELTFSGDRLQTTGQSKALLSKGAVGSPATIEGAWVVKRGQWYYLMYSQGRYDINNGTPEYRVLVARSDKVNGDYQPNNSMKPILEGKAPIVYPGHHSVATDSSGTDWMIYHGYFNGNRNTRSMMIDRITYDTGWPVVNGGNGPSSAQQAGGGGASPTAAAATPSVGCCEASTVSIIAGGSNEEIAWNFFIGKGYTAQQTAGIIGNLKAESGVLPMRKQGTPAETKTSSQDVQTSGSGWGLVQWTPPSKMINPSRDASKSYDEINTIEYQLQFLWEQLEGTGLGGTELSEKAAGDHLKTQTTIDGSARSFMTKYERPADQSESKQIGRVQLANEVFGLYGAGSAPVSTIPSSLPSNGCGASASGGSVVSIAQAELAKNVKEDPLGCDSANSSSEGSCGPEVDKYTDKHLEYWCADFVSWVYKQSGRSFTGGASGGWRIAAVSSIESWFKANGTWVNNGPGVIPNPGDVYTMGISHTGIVEKVEDNIVYTISGNTATDNTGNGNGVGRGSYPVGSSDILGYGSMK
ncbi:MAG: phage tail tip lysozyme [Patescibacteria group bacterium]